MISDESLKLKSQVCFSLYACARRVARSYAPFLDPLGLTYTQYVTMMVLWEEEQITIRDLCQKLYHEKAKDIPNQVCSSLTGRGCALDGEKITMLRDMLQEILKYC